MQRYFIQLFLCFVMKKQMQRFGENKKMMYFCTRNKAFGNIRYLQRKFG